jgi:hypothetical protein
MRNIDEWKRSAHLFGAQGLVFRGIAINGIKRNHGVKTLGSLAIFRSQFFAMLKK